MVSDSKRRRLIADIARKIFGVCASVAVIALGGICTILGINAFRAFTTETGGLTEEETAMFNAEELAEIQSTMHESPGFFEDFVGAIFWMPGAEDPTYGILAMVVSTLLVTAGAMAIAVPVGVSAAGWLAYRAEGKLREVMKFSLEMLAAIPSVVLGFIGIVVLGPLISDVTGTSSGLNALNGSLLLAVMALPTIISISEDSFASVKPELLRGSLALGADGWQTFVRMAIPAARSGLFAAILLGMGRAVGETMTVLMATGNVIAMPTSLLDPVRTMTATIAIELGEVPRDTTHYFMLFAVGLVLFLITLAVNIGADWAHRRGSRG